MLCNSQQDVVRKIRGLWEIAGASPFRTHGLANPWREVTGEAAHGGQMVTQLR